MIRICEKSYLVIAILFMFCLQIEAQLPNIITRADHWDDTVRVIIIWNSGTGQEEMPWGVAIGEIGEDTRDYVDNSLHLINDDNIKFYSGDTPNWNNVTLNTFKDDFNGDMPHVIVYINAGYTWDQYGISNANPPYEMLKKATLEGIGVVAIGDDAAYDAQQIFPLTGPGGVGNPIQYDDKDPAMASAIDAGYKKLWVWLDTLADNFLPDGGLLYEMSIDTLKYKPWEKNGRGQADADIWYIDETKLDNYSFIGFQQTYMSWDQTYVNNILSRYIGSTPQFIVAPTSNQYLAKYSYEYDVVAALQLAHQRVVLLGYQPQYLSDLDNSSQLVYNALYWASKAHEVLKLPTPVATPSGGIITTDVSIALTVPGIVNTNLYKVYYTLDGSTPSETNGILYDPANPIIAPDDDFTLKAIAISQRPDDWFDSDIMIEKYEVVGIIISANPDNGTHFSFDTTIVLSTVPGGTEIYYTLDGSTPSKTNGFLYTSPVTISNNTTLKAVAYKDGHVPGTGKWKYYLDLQSSWIKADPDDGTWFSNTLDITLSSNADSIYYTTDGSDPSQNGILFSGPFTISGEIVIVKGIALGHGWDTASGIWKYKQKYLHVNANPASCSFTNSLSVELSLEVDWPDATIIYTLDGTVPDILDSGTKKYDGTKIVITEETKLTTYAFAPDASPKDTTEEKYIRQYFVTNAWYMDAGGDGGIDMAELSMDGYDSDKLPKRILCTNPYVQTETFDVTNEFVSWKNNDPSTLTIIASLFEQFAYIGNTSFPTDKYGRIDDKDNFHEEEFDVRDGVAPVIDAAVFFPGQIQNEKTGKRYKDTLLVKFTERVEMNSYNRPFKLIRDKNGKDRNYYFKLKLLKKKDNQIWFIVDAINGVDSPHRRDSIWIDIKTEVEDEMGNIQRVTENRRAELIVKPKPFFVEITALHPFDPYDKTELDVNDNSINTGTIIIIDPLVDYYGDEMKKITCRIDIFDPTGNLVVFSEGIDKKNDLLDVYIVELNDRKKLVVFWSGKNKHHRYVGDGFYLAQFNLTGPHHGKYGLDQSVYRKIMVSVKRKE